MLIRRHINQVAGQIAIVLVSSVVGVMPLLAQQQGAGSRENQPANSATTTAHVTQEGADPAYLNGYNAGYEAGAADHQAGFASNPHKFRAYQNGTSGWTPDYGSRVDYQSGYRSGFEDGYHDGYANRPKSISAAGNSSAASAGGNTFPVSPVASSTAPSTGTPPATTTPTTSNAVTNAAGSPPVTSSATGTPAATGNTKKAIANGYREGYSAGQFDSNRNAPYNADANTEFKEATAGYAAELGPLPDYEKNFRNGFRQGYEDGFNHRLYNSAIGLRTTDNVSENNNPSAGETASATENAAATDSEGLTIPEGTQISMQLDDTLSTKSNHAGDPFTGTVTIPVWVGAVAAIPAGSKIKGTVSNVERAGKLKGVSQLQLHYDAVEIPGGPSYQLDATTAGIGQASDNQHVGGDEGTVQGTNKTGSTVAKGAGIGAVIGVLTGGMKGAVLGGAAGAAIGTAGAVMSKKDIALVQGQVLTLRLDKPLQLNKQQAQATPTNQ
jgi:hypothetical protein